MIKNIHELNITGYGLFELISCFQCTCAHLDELNLPGIMRGMNTRQTNALTTCLVLLIGLSACSRVKAQSAPIQTISPITPTVSVSLTPSPIPATLMPSPIPATPTPTPFVCSGEVGLVEKDVVSVTNPPQEFFIYLPPCYENSGDMRFPVLYLLHGLTYNKEQWVRLGVPQIADRLISSGQFPPFIIVLPDDPYWNSQAGPGFGDRLIDHVIPFVDENYRTLADRDHRSLGGLSRGAGWTIDLGFTHPELFGALGMHSPAIQNEIAPYLGRLIKAVPEEDRPQLWIDIGDRDNELATALVFEHQLTVNNYVHEFHRNNGDHSENYWGAHAEEYLRWYAQKWREELPDP